MIQQPPPHARFILQNLKENCTRTYNGNVQIRPYSTDEMLFVSTFYSSNKKHTFCKKLIIFLHYIINTTRNI